MVKQSAMFLNESMELSLMESKDKNDSKTTFFSCFLDYKKTTKNIVVYPLIIYIRIIYKL